MHLLLDVGNTNLKWGLHDGNAIIESGCLALIDLDENRLEDINRDKRAVQHVVAATVSGNAVTDTLNAWAVEKLGVGLSQVMTQKEFGGVQCAYANPAQLGVDRWAAMVAAWKQEQAPLIVVDCGTAVTVDAVAADGRHLGGWIAPGPAVMQRSLFQNTAGIPAGSGNFDGEPAANTADAVASGAMLATLGFVDRAVKKFQSTGTAFRLIITGGDAPKLIPHLGDEFQHQPQLVLEGIMLLAGETQ